MMNRGGGAPPAVQLDDLAKQADEWGRVWKEEEAPFGKISLKKSQTVKRTWDEPSMETVDLKHHEFEREPQDVEVAQAPPVCLAVSQ